MPSCSLTLIRRHGVVVNPHARGDRARWRQVLVALQGKYATLLRLRREREALEARGVLALHGEARRARHREGRALARRFPGALRELEALAAQELEARGRAVALALREIDGGAEPSRCIPLWLGLVADWHAALRLGLAVRRWVAQRGRPTRGDEALARDLADSIARAARRSTTVAALISEREPAALVELLRRYVSPPGGKIQDVSWQDLSSRYALPEADLRALVFGASLARPRAGC